jgi:hypothetical protein
MYLGEYGNHSISQARVSACEEETSQAEPKHFKKVIKNQNSRITVYFKYEKQD